MSPSERSTPPSRKSGEGNFLEDFALGQTIDHAVPRTVSAGDSALYLALTGSRFPANCAGPFARRLGFKEPPLDDLLVFHIVFGRTVPDISANAVANLGYAALRFGVPVYPGDTLSARSRIIGLKENSNRKTGVVYVHSTGLNQRGESVVDFIRWVMVHKRDPAATIGAPHLPDLPRQVAPAALVVPPGVVGHGGDGAFTGQPYYWRDYVAGERIDHREGVTIEEACPMMATRLYQNTASVHFNRHAARGGRFGKLIVYGGHIISLARALSFNGLGNAFRIAAINAGSHVRPSFAGDTIYAWSEIREKADVPGREDLGALRVRTIATCDHSCGDFPDREGESYHPAVALDLDYWVLMTR